MNPEIIQLKNSEVAVYQKGQGETSILFIHGNSLNGLMFQKQFNSHLSDKFKLIALDLPGHGNSSKAANPKDTYSLYGYGEVLKDLIAELNLANYYLVGHSLGGHIILDVSEDLDEAMGGVVVFGTPPLASPADMANAFHPNSVLSLAFQEQLADDEAKKLVGEYVMGASPEEMIQALLNTDPNSRAYVGTSIGKGEIKDEVEIVKNLMKPILMIHGEEDALVNTDYINEIAIPKLWKKRVQVIANSGHSPHWEQPEEFNNLVSTFISETGNESSPT